MPAFVLDHAGIRVRAIASAREAVQHGLAAVRRELEHGAMATRASLRGRAIEIAGLVLDQSGHGISAVAAALEVVYNFVFVIPRQRGWNIANGQKHRRNGQRGANQPRLKIPLFRFRHGIQLPCIDIPQH
ncbi:MAG: hypothetical protein WDN04_22895 [Rhodospirillales bacterium]